MPEIPASPSYPFDHAEAAAHLTKQDRRLGRLIAKINAFPFKLDECDSPFESLLEAIAYQSISGKAAATIFARIKALGSNGKCPTPEEILRTPNRALRKAGFSNAKAAAAKDLAQKTIEGIVPSLEEARALSDDELVQRLISVRGIGAWTVEMFLIFRLGRPDVLPIHDYGVQKGFAITYRLKNIPKPKELAAFGERWRPYRTVASWYMWRAVDRAGKAARKITKSTPKPAPEQTPKSRANSVARRAVKSKVKPAAKSASRRKSPKISPAKKSRPKPAQDPAPALRPAQGPRD